jgi:hypothetical protein
MGVGLSQQLVKIEHPFRGFSIDASDIDQMADLLVAVQNEIKQLRVCEYLIRGQLGGMAEGELKTRRLKGETHTLRIEMPADYWDQGTLKELWKRDEMQAKEYLRIATLAPNLREVKKLENCSGNERFEKFKHDLLGARMPSSSPPRVVVEEQNT